jgi:urease gamma subunit
MLLSNKELDSLLIHNAGYLAQKRLARGILLNYPESVSLIICQCLEFVRDGMSACEVIEKSKLLLGYSQVQYGVDTMLKNVTFEATFTDGSKIVKSKL